MSASPLAPHAASATELKEQIDAARGGTPFLVYRLGDGPQQLVHLGDVERVTIGRDPSTDVSLAEDRQVSRVHAELERVGSKWVVVDDGLSRNGTWVNGERVVGRRRLRDRDEIRIGETAIGYCDPGGRSGATTLVPDELPAIPKLSDAQLRVLVALCKPFKDGGAYATPPTNQQIADELYLSLDAVKTHLRVLFQKFDLGDVPQNQKRLRLVERALQIGAVSRGDL